MDEAAKAVEAQARTARDASGARPAPDAAPPPAEPMIVEARTTDEASGGPDDPRMDAPSPAAPPRPDRPSEDARAERGAGETLADLAEARLREDIVAGCLAPEEPLRMEALRGRYGVGASPLREALSRLKGEGLVELRTHRGFIVRALSAEDLADIAIMRTALDAFGLRASIGRGDEDWESGVVAALHKLVRITERTGTDAASLEAWQRAHDAFHRALVAACGSARLLEAHDRLALQHARYRRHLMGANLPRDLLIAEHRGLAEAALARDATRAEALIARHMTITSEFYAAALKGGRG